MGFDNDTSQLKTHTSAFGLAGHFRGTVETVKDMGNILGSNSRSLVADADDDRIRADLADAGFIGQQDGEVGGEIGKQGEGAGLALEDLPVIEFEKSEYFDEHHHCSGNQEEMNAFFEDR